MPLQGVAASSGRPAPLQAAARFLDVSLVDPGPLGGVELGELVHAQTDVPWCVAHDNPPSCQAVKPEPWT